MEIIRYLISLLEFDVKKDNKTYSEEDLAKFAKRAILYSFIFPLNSFFYAARAKKSKDPITVKEAKQAETIVLFLLLPILLIIIIGVSSWLFSNIWLAIILIVIICFIIYKMKFSRKK